MTHQSVTDLIRRANDAGFPSIAAYAVYLEAQNRELQVRLKLKEKAR